jgi:hypothetical protein
LNVGVTQELVRDLLRARLPLETVVRDRFRVSLSEADVKFDAGESVVLLDGRVRSVGSGEAPPGVVRDLMEGLAGRGLGALGEVIPPIEIPMHLDQEIVSRGYSDERVQVPAARLGLKIRVKRLVPLAGRLWIQLEIA